MNHSVETEEVLLRLVETNRVLDRQAKERRSRNATMNLVSMYCFEGTFSVGQRMQPYPTRCLALCSFSVPRYALAQSIDRAETKKEQKEWNHRFFRMCAN
jgi:hypothetical protein